MNKTRKRAMQKHRAQTRKFEVRRKSSNETPASRPRTGTHISRHGR